MMLNCRGPKSVSRRLYAAPVWEAATNKCRYIKGLESNFRLGALRIASGFRTVSTDAIMVISGIAPVEFTAKKASKIFREKKSVMLPSEVRAVKEAARNRCFSMWQAKWDSSANGRGTHKLFPKIEPWVNRKHGELNFHLTQLLSGHGCFRQYLNRFGREDDPMCPVCSTPENAEHVLLRCPRFDVQRQGTESTLGTNVSTENSIPLMLASQENWTAVCTLAEGITSELRRIERQRRRETVRP
ncbi:hypothetical protein ACLKA7_000215 [Drosophila subpalustris]